jgi:plasmid rolling circle replication initiator protein Rep
MKFSQDRTFKDKSQTGKDRKWRERKLQNIELGSSLEKLGYKTFANVYQCAEVLKFREQENGNLKLFQTWFCKNKLCPICNWRRAMKYSYQTSLIVDEAIKENSKGRFLFLTLTVENVVGENLNQAMSEMTKAFNRMMRYKKVSKNLLGYLRATEVTKNELMNTYHPHLHVLLFVSPLYFQGEGDNYIKQDEWTNFWKKSAKLSYTPIVNVKAVKPNSKNEFDKNGMKKAILETAKYPTKPIKFDEENLETVEDLYLGLYRKKLISYGGIFKEIRKRVFLDDVEEGDLINVAEGEKENSLGKEVIAFWNWERKNYFLR